MSVQRSYGGLLIPLDMFRLSQLAALFAEVLVSKARNILDAKMVAARHPASPLLLIRIEGHVVGDDEAAFWRENADLAAIVSQALPRQVFMFYVQPGPREIRREGFLVAQRGQVLAADDATSDNIPADAADSEWPVSRLCGQLRLSLDDLALGFPEGPRVEVPLAEPNIDDQAALMTLVGREPGEPAPPNEGAPTGAPAGAAAPRVSVDEDAKRRAKEAAADEEALRARAEAVKSDLPHMLDDFGLVVAPRAELSEADILAPFIVAKVEGDLPAGVPAQLMDRLQGKRIDIAVRVEFLSEVFVENTPLNRATFEERAQTIELAGRHVRSMEVLGPRLGYGTLFSTGKSHVFVSRRTGMPVPAGLVLEMLG